MENHRETTGYEPVLIRVVAEIRADRELAESTQHEIVRYLGSLGGVAAEVSIDRNPTPSETLDQSSDPKMRTGLAEMFEDFENSVLKTRTLNALEREGIHSARDLLAVGKWEVSDIRNLGAMSLDLIEQGLQRRIGQDVVWQDNPGIDTIARYYASVAEIPLAALEESSVFVGCRCRSVGEILALDFDELSVNFGITSHRPDRQNTERARRALAAVNNFVFRFEEARARITGENY